MATLDALLREYAALATEHGPQSKQAIAARNRIVELNIKLLFTISKRVRSRGLDPEDARAYGVLGLITAVERFDSSRGFAFSTYAQWWIRHAISRAAQNVGGNIRVSVHAAEGKGKRPEVVEAAAAAHRVTSLHVPIDADVGGMTFLDQLPASGDPDALDQLIAA